MTYVRQLLLLGLFTVLGFALFTLLFFAGVATSIPILFYRGILIAAGAAFAIGIAALWVARRSGDASLPISAAAVSFSFNICFLVLLPVTIDRSVSVYLLSTIEQRQQAGVSPSELERLFVAGYVRKMDAVGRRIAEQKASGNITVDGKGQVRLTEQGLRFLRISRLLAPLFGTDLRYVRAPETHAHGKPRN